MVWTFLQIWPPQYLVWYASNTTSREESFLKPNLCCALSCSPYLLVLLWSPHTQSTHFVLGGKKNRARYCLALFFFCCFFFFARYYIVCWTKTRKQKQKKPKHTDKGREIDTKGRQKIHNRYTANLLTYKTSQPASERANVRTFVCLRSLDGG